MPFLRDEYGWKARAVPVYLALAPLILIVPVLVPGAMQIPLGGLTAVVFAPLAYLAGQIGADFGKRLEADLWTKWGGPPATRFLRHSNNEFNSDTRDRVHEKLRSLGLTVPSEAQEVENGSLATQRYDACIEELVRRTRDQSRFPMVYRNLTDYGFRRNMLGLRSAAIVVAVGSASILVAIGLNLIQSGDRPLAAVALAIALGLLFSWTLWVSEEAVKLSADRYARALLEGALSLG